jgi:hypothetical protein
MIHDCLTARTACLVCFISTVNGWSKKNETKPEIGASSGHITNFKQSILETFNIYGMIPCKECFQNALAYFTKYYNNLD